MVLPRGDALRPVAFAPDEKTAERWAAILEDSGIEAHIRIEDGAAFTAMGSAYGPMLGGRAFVYPVLVSRLRHRAARRALEGSDAAIIDAPAITPSSVASALAVLAGSMLLVAYLVWARGDL
jgi:hypothetical protein